MRKLVVDRVEFYAKQLGYKVATNSMEDILFYINEYRITNIKQYIKNTIEIESNEANYKRMLVRL